MTAAVLVALFVAAARPRLPGEVMAGDMVTLAITSDRTSEFHLHGYGQGAVTTLTFPATPTGHFAIADEGARAELGTLIVSLRGT